MQNTLLRKTTIFDVLKNIEFPKVDVVNIQTFLNDLKKIE